MCPIVPHAAMRATGGIWDSLGARVGAKQMVAVFDLDLPPDHGWVLMAVARYSDHDGRNAFPLMDTLATDTGFDVKKIQRINADLVRRGLLVIEAHARRGRAVTYAVHPEIGPFKAGRPIKKVDTMNGELSTYSSTKVDKKPSKVDRKSTKVDKTAEKVDSLNGDLSDDPTLDPLDPNKTDRSIGMSVTDDQGSPTQVVPDTHQHIQAELLKLTINKTSVLRILAMPLWQDVASAEQQLADWKYWLTTPAAQANPQRLGSMVSLIRNGGTSPERAPAVGPPITDDDKERARQYLLANGLSNNPTDKQVVDCARMLKKAADTKAIQAKHAEDAEKRRAAEQAARPPVTPEQREASLAANRERTAQRERQTKTPARLAELVTMGFTRPDAQQMIADGLDFDLIKAWYEWWAYPPLGEESGETRKTQAQVGIRAGQQPPDWWA